MKIITDHRFYAPTFQAIADILDKDYEIKYDHTDKELSLSLVVIHKKYKAHGFTISTYLGSDPEWTINAYVDLPIDTYDIMSTTFKPLGRYDTEYGQFPKLTDEQIIDLKQRINKIAKNTIQNIQDYIKDLNDGHVQMSTSDIKRYYINGFENLDNFKYYGVDLNYEEFLITPRKNMLVNFNIVEGIYNSKIKELRKLLPLAISMYIREMQLLSLDNAIHYSKRFLTFGHGGILGEFTDEHNQLYLNMVKSMFENISNNPAEQLSKVDDMVYDIRAFKRSIDNNKTLLNMINSWAYNMTNDEHFLSQEAKDIFLF